MLHRTDLLSLALIALAAAIWLWGLIDCARTPADRVRFVPRVLWLLFLFNGSVVATLAWVYFGKKPTAGTAEARVLRRDPCATASAP
ncbi:hypothetical protein AB0M19_01630 [Streptomyces sp. NPDC051920]|uniref:hypothetical protein n=1 Tax=Streptomyces sp. NPDC051920 TaxID=3155523 RepID=UPI00344919E5